MSVFYAVLFMSVSFEVIYMLVYCWPFILSILYTQMYSLSYPVNTDQNIDDSSSTFFFFCQIKFFLTNDNVPPFETTLNWLASSKL